MRPLPLPARSQAGIWRDNGLKVDQRELFADHPNKITKKVICQLDHVIFFNLENLMF